MLKKISNFFDLAGVGLEMKIYDILHVICFLVLLFSSFLVNYFFESKTVVYVTIGIAFLFLVTLVEANRTGKLEACAIVMSIILNLFYLPVLFASFGKYVCVVPLFFLFGISYTCLMLESRVAVPLGIFEIFYYLFFILIHTVYSKSHYINLVIKERATVYLATIAGVVIVSVFIGMTVRYRYVMYKKEENRAKSIRESALEEYISKDMFLTNMSHEIRTPMNAIVGNVNLMLDETDDSRIRDNVYSILNSCDALISIVNELMDLSKTESKDQNIETVKFDIYELIMEIINMISVRMMDDASEFYAYINKNLPRYVIGDSSKVRQAIVWVLNIAGRYVHDGSITLSVDFEKCTEGGILLKAKIECTGYPEEVVVQKSEDEQSIYACMELLERMGGSAVNKHDGNVSKVYISIPLQIDGNENIQSNLSKISDCSVLYYEKNDNRREALKMVIDNFGIESCGCETVDDLISALVSGKFTHVLIATEIYSECYEKIKEYLNKEKLITISDVGGNIENRGVYATIMRPVHCVNVFGALAEENYYSVHRAINKGDFELINASILVVDDNFTNLSVASSLLKKYGAEILTASSGLDAIRVLSEQKVQLVFLDYMMPDLNGIDTLNMIREMENGINKDVPAVALSANVVSGAYEMFMSSGFSGFIPKPIDVGKLEKCLKELMPPECIVYKRTEE